MATGKTVWIYHEQQDSLLCGQHALNNLIQQENFFHPGQLAEIAHQLDAEERQFLGISGPSNNVDAQGNFSIQVITNALTNIGIDLSVWNMKRNDKDPSQEIGFIVNRDSHWFAIRRINNHWWNLNSSQDKPEHIGDFYLGAFLSQLSSDGYSVFVAHGDFPHVHGEGGNGGPFWHRESDILKKGSNSEVEKFSGQGMRLGGIADDEDEDAQIARAIALSFQDMNATSTDVVPEMTEKEKIRAKRLAAMGKSSI